MRWVSPDALEFDTHEGKAVQISLSGDLWRLEERKTSDQVNVTTTQDRHRAGDRDTRLRPWPDPRSTETHRPTRDSGGRPTL